jgi:hypothetical protein
VDRHECKHFIYIFFLYILVQSEDLYGLTVTPEHVNVDVGAHPTFTCSVKKPANFVTEHPIKWERHDWMFYQKIGSLLYGTCKGRMGTNIYIHMLWGNC